MRISRVKAKNLVEGDRIVVTVARVMGVQGRKPRAAAPLMKLEYEDGTSEVLREDDQVEVLRFSWRHRRSPTSALQGTSVWLTGTSPRIGRTRCGVSGLRPDLRADAFGDGVCVLHRRRVQSTHRGLAWAVQSRTPRRCRRFARPHASHSWGSSHQHGAPRSRHPAAARIATAADATRGDPTLTVPAPADTAVAGTTSPIAPTFADAIRLPSGPAGIAHRHLEGMPQRSIGRAAWDTSRRLEPLDR